MISSLAAAIALAAALPLGVQQQTPQRDSGWPCVGRPDPTYVRLAEATGGALFLFAPSEFGESGAVLAESDRHHDTLLRMAGSLNAGTHDVPVPVDSTVESVMFSVSLQCVDLVDIIGPDGQALATGAPDVEQHRFRAGAIAIVRAPAPGTWHVRTRGRGLFFLVVQARSAISLDSVNVAEGTVRLRVSGDAHEISARLVSGGFDPIATLALTPVSSHDEESEWLARAHPPSLPFRIVVTGRDGRGWPFQRVHAQLLER